MRNIYHYRSPVEQYPFRGLYVMLLIIIRQLTPRFTDKSLSQRIMLFFVMFAGSIVFFGTIYKLIFIHS